MTVNVADKIALPDCEEIAQYPIPNERWHELRRTGIGGSDAGAVMGANPYASPLTVWMQKTGRESPDMQTSENAEVGTLFEPFIRREIMRPYLIDNGYVADIEIIEPWAMFRSTRFHFATLNADGFASVLWPKSDDAAGVPIYNRETVGIEIKTGTAHQSKHWAHGRTPISYWWQVQHSMMVTGLQTFILFGVIGNRRTVRIIGRDDDAIDRLIIEERELWERVERGGLVDAPMPLGIDADDEALKALGQPAMDDEADLSDIEADVDRYYSLGREIKDLQQLRKQAKQKILHAMGQSLHGRDGRYRVGRTQYTVTRVDTGRLTDERPDIAEQYSTTDQRERLDVKEVENE
jgi:putative phage-type endonuclease